MLDYIAQNYPKQRKIIDIGANIGNHTVYFGRYLEFEEIIAFEADWENFILLNNNLFYNHLAKNVKPIHAAISDWRGKIGLQKNSNNYGAHEVHKEIYDNLVACYPLDWFNLDDVTLIKIDAERHEPEILAGARRTIERNKPLIIIEDVDQVYDKLLPQYRLAQSWPHHRTYLYEWKE